MFFSQVQPGDAVLRATRETVYEFSRIELLGGWWGWAIAVAVIAGLIYLCIWLYRRDTVELAPAVRTTLLWLRLSVIVALVFFFFGLQRRTQQRVTRPSEVAVLVDTSQSMSLPAAADSGAAPLSRAGRAAQLLGESGLLENLEQQHRLSVYAFDQQSEPVELESRMALAAADAGPSQRAAGESTAAVPDRLAMLGALGVVAMVLLSLASFVLAAGGRPDAIGGPLLSAAVLLPLSVVLLGGAWATQTDRTLAELLGFETSPPAAASPEAEPGDQPPGDQPPSDQLPENLRPGEIGAGPLLAEKADRQQPQRRVSDWNAALAAAGSETRIGDAVRAVLSRHDPATLAGIVLLSDGQGNAGVSSSAVAALARRSEVAIYPLGLGSSDAPTNVRLVDLDVPRRVYPGDKFALSAVLQASGSQEITAEVQLVDGLDDPETELTEVIDSRQVQLPADGTLVPLRFELTPETVGRRRLAVRVVPPPEDQNEEDNAREARYEVVARKLRVLAIAGGPTREYQFLRNLLYRDDSVELDVWLQTAVEGISQDADRLLGEFPATAEELFQYDAIVAIDPDWTEVPVERLQLMQRWLSEQAGGMVLIGGPIYMPQWTRMRTDPRVTILNGIFPVELATRSPLLSGGRQGGDAAFDLEFTAEARRADFLFIAEDPQQSFDVWASFGGVYDYVGVKDPKPGAKVYAYFSDPSTRVGDSLPVYLASQFYGAGRTYFQASGEMWRLRSESDAYFDSYYTKLLRWVSEGRLLRDSNRGVLMVDNPRAGVGDTITVRAVLTDPQFEPLQAERVQANLLGPGDTTVPLELLPVEGQTQAGTYGGRFVARAAGNYEVRLALDDAAGDTVLRQSVQVRLPTAELERPQRNDEELAAIATMTRGEYLRVDDDASAAAAAQRLGHLLQPQPQTMILPGSPDDAFAERRNASLLWLIAAALTFEWVVRRLHRLA